MKILFVCQQYIHAARWINQLKDSHHKIYVFDCLDRPLHEDLSWVNFIGNWRKRKIPYIKGEEKLRKKAPFFYSKLESLFQVTASDKLIEIIKQIQPDLVHSLEMQSQTYHVLKAKNKFNFKWAYSTWGSDLYLFKNHHLHKKKINKIIPKIDYFFSDNQRDIKQINDFNFLGTKMPVFPGGGGYELQSFLKYNLPLHKRNTIIIKGYHHWAGKALFVLDALELIINVIRDYDIFVYSAHQIVVERIEEINTKHNLKIEYSTRNKELSQNNLFKKFGQSKVAIGNSISDGIPNTLLESIICGAFPIQSNPGGATEYYIEDRKNGLLIKNPQNSQEIAQLIKEALTNDELIKNAFQINQDIAKTLAYKNIQKQVLESYHKIESSL